jgi:hypothetical protein
LPFVEGSAYFAALVPVVWLTRQAMRAGHLTRGAVAALMVAACAIAPALFAPGPRYFIVQLRGWEYMFAAFSFAVEGAASDEDPSLADCAFFLLINPTLVYAQRARPAEHPQPRLGSLLRVVLGVVTLAGHGLLFSTIDGVFREPPALTAAVTARGYAIVMGYYLARFAAGYWAHSGRASLDVGLVRLLGFDVPERYRFPFLATNPAEFWRRWNTYIGSWFRRYVFTPAAVGWQKRRALPWSSANKGTAVLATFVAGGLIHDLSVYLRFGKTAFGATLAFAVHGVALVLWAVVSELRPALRVPRVASTWLRPLGAAVGYAAFLHVLALSSWVAIPGMGEGKLPRELSVALDLSR